MSELTCEQLGELAEELALGVLPGPARGRALAHLDRCDACAADIRQLSAVTDGLLGLVPVREPPIGFENRMVSRLGFAARRRPRRAWLAAAAVAAVIATVFALGGFALGTAINPGTSATAQAGLLRATLATGSHPVGTVYAATSTPSWVYMMVDTDHVTGTVSCQLQQRDGHVVTIGAFDVTNGYGSWGAPSPVNPTTVAAVRLVAIDGTVIATATFPTS